MHFNRLRLAAVIVVVTVVSVIGMMGVAQATVIPGMCETQLNNEISAMLASSAPMENWEPDTGSLWGCTLLSENDRREVGTKVMQMRGPEIMAKAFEQAFAK